MSRQLRTAAAVALAAVIAIACSSPEPADPEPPSCGPTPPSDVTTAAGWIGYIAAHAETSSFVVDNGRGQVIEHRPDDDRPLASAVKVVHLAAYAQAVAAGALDPDELIPVSEWERWYLPGTDGMVHPAALKRLGIPHDEYASTDPTATVRLDDMVSAMIQESDNAVPDYLRYRLGDQALADAASTGGWPDFAVPTLIGSTLGALSVAPVGTDQWELAKRYAFDDAFHEQVQNTATVGSYASQIEYFATNGARGSASGLTAYYRSVLDGSYGSATDVIRRQLEWSDPGPNFVSFGIKGGNVPGVLTQGIEATRPDGTTATAVLLISGTSEDDDSAALANIDHEYELLVSALEDDDTLNALGCVG